MNEILRNVFLRRDLVWQLALKDLKTRYSRPVLGCLWAFLIPFVTTLVMYIVFSKILKVTVEGVPFFLYLMIAVFSWDFFRDTLNSCTVSFLANRNLIKESNFPHYLIIFSIVVANLINFIPSLFIIVIASLVTRAGVPGYIILLPGILVLHALIITGISMATSTLYVKWRDIKYMLDAALLVLFYATPVFYPVNLVKDSFGAPALRIYMSNPFVGILDMYRIALLNGFSGHIRPFTNLTEIALIPLAFAVIVFYLGSCVYRRNKKGINDHLSY